MNRTKIEWVKNPDGTQGYTINPVKGLCPMACPYCYAKRMYKRFKWDTEITYMPPHHFAWAMNQIKKPTRIFVGSTMELFGDFIDPVYMNFLFGAIANYSQHTFIFLTKQPQNLIKWSPFPDNCWVGMTVTRDGIGNSSAGAIPCFEDIEAKVKFISFEPLLERVKFGYYADFVDWVIIGAQTPYSPETAPKMSWVQDILVAASNAGNIPVFMKNNLQPVIDRAPGWGGWKLRQEMPKE